jgi:RES domain-containing protein
VLYAAATVAGAMVEILVHYAAMPIGMCLSRIEIPDNVSISDASASLTAEWAKLAKEDQEVTRKVGSVWFNRRVSAVLIVPSFVAHGEQNYLLNPLHPEFKHVRFFTPEPFDFDPRLK